MTYPIEKIRQDFPVLSQMIGKKPLVFMDTTSSAQKPSMVIDGVAEFYKTSYANIHRGLYDLSQKSSTAYEQARTKVKSFLNAKHEDEIIFTKGTTDSINLVASSFGKMLQAGDEIILTQAEHHANIIPWHYLAQEKGIVIKWLPINDDGSLAIEKLDELLSPKTKMVAITYISNVLGIIYPVKEIIKKAHQIGAKVLIDGCQAAAHMPIDVQDLDCDFFAISAHKLYGPSGVGALYGKKELLDQMPPYQGGGGMVGTVTYDTVTYASVPSKFEAGTPAIAETYGFGLALDYLTDIGMDNIANYEAELTTYMIEQLSQLDWLKVIGTAQPKTGIFSFYMDNIHPQDIAMILNKQGIATRSGTHCAEPLHHRLNVPFVNSVRASLGIYNTKDEIDTFIAGIKKVKDFF